MLRIGIDARPLQGETKHRGIGKTLQNLIVALRQVDKNNRYVFYVDSVEPVPTVLKDLQKNESVKQVESQKIRRARYVRSVLKSFKPFSPSQKDIDIFLQPDASLGVSKSVPTTVIFYDLIPLLFRKQEKLRAKKSLKKYKSMLANEVYWTKYKKDLKQYKKAVKILSISAASKNDLVKYMPELDANKVSVLHLGVTPPSKLTVTTTVAKEYQPYILYVGGIDYRKNIQALLNDFFELKPKYPKLKLVLVGKEFGLKAQLADLGWDKIMQKNKQWQGDVITPGFVSDDELRQYYKNATAFIFPSIYEGFGLPVLEAMAMESPVIAYKNSSIPEVAGDAALLVADGESLVPYIDNLLSDSKLKQDLIAKGLKRVQSFTWESSAKELVKQLESTGDVKK